MNTSPSTSPATAAERVVRDERLDYLKGVLMFLVVWAHVIQFVGYGAGWNRQGFWSDPVFRGIYLFHMPLFMALAGYLRAGALLRDPSGRGLWRTCLGLALPVLAWYVLFKGAFLGLAALRGEAVNLAPMHLLSRALDEVFFQSWFVWCVLAFDGLLFVLHRLRLDRAWLLALLSFLGLWLPDGSILFLLQFMLPFFCLGYLAARTKPRQARAQPRSFLWPGLWLACLLPSLAAYFLWTPAHYVYNQNWSALVLDAGSLLFRYGSSLLASVAALGLLLSCRSFLQSAWLLRVGRESLLIYIVQGLVLFVCSGLRLAFQETPWFSLLLAPVAAFALCTVITWLGALLGRSPVLALVLGARRTRP